MRPADYARWRSKKLWTLKEFASLLKGWEPKERENHPQFEKVDPHMDEVENLHTYLCDIAERDPDLRQKSSHSRSGFVAPQGPIDSRRLVLWAFSIEGLTIPRELSSFAPESDNSPEQQKKRPTDGKKLTTKERETLLLIIAAMAKNLKLDLSHPHAAADVVIKMLDFVGVSRSPNTVASKLSEAHKLLKNMKT